MSDFTKSFAAVLKNSTNELRSYTFTRYTNTLMDILMYADPCISKNTLKVEIINNQLRILKKPDDSALIKRRSEGLIILLEKTLECHEISDCVLYLYVRDTYIKYDEPFYIYARPINKKGLLLLDHTYIDAEQEKKISKEKGGELIDIKDIRDQIKMHSSHNISPRLKKNSLFFIGQNVPLINSSNFMLRKYFSKLAWPYTVKTVGHMQMAEFSAWKYLLNLPGWYPWSFRFKFLFLMNSFVISINLTRENEHKWIQAMDLLFVPNKDYIEINFPFIPNNIGILSEEILEVFRKFNYDKSAFDKIVESGRQKGALLTNENVYKLNATIFNMYAKRCNKLFIQSDISKSNIRTDEYKLKMQAGNSNIIYSNISKIYQINEAQVLKVSKCSLSSYFELKAYEKLNNKYAAFLHLHDCFIIDDFLYLLLDSHDINLYDYVLAHKMKKKTWDALIIKLKADIAILHRENIYHNNIIPENILYSYKHNKFYIIDFKMARNEGSADVDIEGINKLGASIELFINEVSSKYSINYDYNE